MNGISIDSRRVFFKIYQVVSLPGRGKHRYEVFNRPTCVGDMLEAWLLLMVTSFPGSLTGTKRTTALRPCTFFWSPAWEEHGVNVFGETKRDGQ